MKYVGHFWHVCTEGLRDRLIFRDTTDFIQGMNAVALCSAGRRVAVLAFCLMDNHVHFVLNAEEEDATSFIRNYMRRLGVWLSGRYGETSPLGHINKMIRPVATEEELARVIAYVHRNPLAAGICEPISYEWSSASCFFSPRRIRKIWRRVGDIRVKEREKLLRSRLGNLPAGSYVNDEGMVMPQFYLQIRVVEKLYGNASGYMYALNTNRDAETEKTLLSGKDAFPDSHLRVRIREICKQTYGREDVNSLSISELSGLAVTLHKQYGCAARQIARLTGMKKEYLSQLLGETHRARHRLPRQA